MLQSALISKEGGCPACCDYWQLAKPFRNIVPCLHAELLLMHMWGWRPASSQHWLSASVCSLTLNCMETGKTHAL